MDSTYSLTPAYTTTYVHQPYFHTISSLSRTAIHGWSLLGA